MPRPGWSADALVVSHHFLRTVRRCVSFSQIRKSKGSRRMFRLACISHRRSRKAASRYQRRLLRGILVSLRRSCLEPTAKLGALGSFGRFQRDLSGLE